MKTTGEKIYFLGFSVRFSGSLALESPFMLVGGWRPENCLDKIVIAIGRGDSSRLERSRLQWKGLS